jgi:hypothetical protein
MVTFSSPKTNANFMWVVSDKPTQCNKDEICLYLIPIILLYKAKDLTASNQSFWLKNKLTIYLLNKYFVKSYQRSLPFYSFQTLGPTHQTPLTQISVIHIQHKSIRSHPNLKQA